jgi:hypothetical protein
VSARHREREKGKETGKGIRWGVLREIVEVDCVVLGRKAGQRKDGCRNSVEIRKNLVPSDVKGIDNFGMFS